MVSRSAVLIVSPHHDDAVLSCFALLEHVTPADVLTVFGGRPEPPQVAWSERAMGFPDSDATMSARRAEDAHALTGLAGTVETMDLLDEDYIEGPRPPAQQVTVQDHVLRWLQDRPEGLVAAPAGAGRAPGRLRARIERLVGPRGSVTQHPDHVFVRNALVDLIARGAIGELLLYEELPYLWHKGAARESARVARSARTDLRSFELPVNRIAKAQRISCYVSQLDHLSLDGRRVEEPAALPPTERYGLLTCRGRTS
jgi:LmbE family N-acetylglucosaminyl deacetylase